MSIVEPGVIDTAIWGKSGDATQAMSTPDHPARALYAHEIDAVIRLAAESAGKAIPASAVAAAVERCLLAKRAPMQVLVGPDAKLFATFKRLLPGPVFEQLLLMALKLPTPPRRAVRE